MSLLTQPLTLGTLTLANRLVMPPMATAKSAGDGSVTEELCHYYEERAAGGHIGLIITEHSYISPEGMASKGQLSIARDGDVAGLRTLTERIHGCGSAVFAQLSHAGGRTNSAVTGLPALAPTAQILPNKRAGASTEVPREMTGDDMAKVVRDFAAAARRAREAGFDGVEIHSAHSYLLDQFYSPLANRRTDAYGGSLQNRIRLHLEVIAAVRETVGPNYPVALRLGACDFLEGGSTLDDAIEAAKAFEGAGIDLLDISGGFWDYIRPGCSGQGYFGDITQAIRQKISLPVVLTGGITESQAAEALLAEGKADLIGVGRALLKDPRWAERAMAALS